VSRVARAPASRNGRPDADRTGPVPERDGQLPFTRLDDTDPALFEELMQAIRRVGSSAAFTLGEEVAAFERDFAAYCDCDHAVGVSSGTDALVLSLRALGVGPGDEVLVPANSFVATAEAVTLVGATPRLVDVDAESHTLTAEIVQHNLGPRTRCVIPVHLYGRTVDLDPVVELARAAGIAVVEDACQAHGARYRGRHVGTVGDCGCFSFYPAKNLGGWGDGGAVVTADPEIAERVRLLRSHGEQERNRHRLPGTTARLDAVQAAVLGVKLGRLDEWNETRRRLAAAMTEALEGSPVKPPSPLQDGEDHVFHQYVVTSRDRDGLRRHLARRGVSTAVHYPVPIHLSGAYRGLGMGRGSLPTAEALAERVCSLPIFPTMTEGDVERVVQAVHDFEPAGSRLRSGASAA